MTDTKETRQRAGLHDEVMLVSKMFFDDYTPRHGRVVAVDGDTISAEFPDPHGRPGYPPMTFHLNGVESSDYLTVTRKADVDELDKAKAEVERMRERLSEIGAYAGEWATGGYDSGVLAAFQRIARLARRA